MQEQQIANEAGLLAYGATVAVLGGIAWGAAATIGGMIKTRWFKKSKLVKRATALGTGAVLGLVGYGAGFLPAPKPGMWAFAFAALMGLLGAAIAIAGQHGGEAVAAKIKPKGKLPQ